MRKNTKYLSKNPHQHLLCDVSRIAIQQCAPLSKLSLPAIIVQCTLGITLYQMWQAKMLLLALWYQFKCFMGPLGASSSFIIYTVSAGFRHALSLSGADTLWTTQNYTVPCANFFFWEWRYEYFEDFRMLHDCFFFHIEGEIFKTSKVTAHEWNLWSSVSQTPQTELYYSSRNVKPPLHLSSPLLSFLHPPFIYPAPNPFSLPLHPLPPPLLTLRCCRGV